MELPQSGRCLCGEVGYCLEEAPLAVYACRCTDCQTQTGSSFKLCAIVRADALRVLEPGTLDDTTWVRPAARIWTRSRQPWAALPEGDLRFEAQREPQEWIEVIRAWKQRAET